MTNIDSFEYRVKHDVETDVIFKAHGKRDVFAEYRYNGDEVEIKAFFEIKEVFRKPDLLSIHQEKFLHALAKIVPIPVYLVIIDWENIVFSVHLCTTDGNIEEVGLFFENQYKEFIKGL